MLQKLSRQFIKTSNKNCSTTNIFLVKTGELPTRRKFLTINYSILGNVLHRRFHIILFFVRN